MIETVDPFGWHKITAEKLIEIKDKIRNFESMTWADILVSAKKNNHSIPIDDLCKTAKERIKDLQLDDIDQLVSLRLSGTERIWGVLQDGVMLLLWWDPDHQVCPSPLKFT